MSAPNQFAGLLRLLNRDATRRLGIAVLVYLAVVLLLSPWLQFETRALVAWDAAAIAFLLLAYSAMRGASPEQTGLSAGRQDQSGTIILALVVVAATASLFAIGFLLRHAKGFEFTGRAGLMLIAVVAIASSWLMVHTMFALHYAHRYYGDNYSPKGIVDEGLRFPEERRPDYMDFVYVSFVIGMTAQVSDVQVTSRPMRRLVLIHGILSFGFFAGILALLINIVAGLI